MHTYGLPARLLSGHSDAASQLTLLVIRPGWPQSLRLSGVPVFAVSSVFVYHSPSQLYAVLVMSGEAL